MANLVRRFSVGLLHRLLGDLLRCRLSKLVLRKILTVEGYTYQMWDVVTRHNADFLRQVDFVRAYEACLRQKSISDVAWSIHVHQWAATYAMDLPGDFVECGVYRGGVAMSNIVYTRFQDHVDRKYYLFDTYSGLSEEYSSPREYAKYGAAYTNYYDFVLESFGGYRNVIIVKGVLPDTLRTVEIDNVAYLHIDMNCVLPEIETFRFFWPKMCSGGIVIFDDYAQVGHEEQKKAFDEVAQSYDIRILSLPTGQGMVLKR